MTLRERLAPLVHGDVADDIETLHAFSRDTSIFERKPSVVVYPKDESDVSAVVHFVREARAAGEAITLTGRSAGTDMTGGPLTDSIVVSFTKYMNHVIEIGNDFAVAEPGVYYRDFEKATLAKMGMLLPSYPASRELCAIGGIVSNNSGGELTLRYGKTDRYVRALEVVLSDGTRARLRPLSRDELVAKKSERTFEGEIYAAIKHLIETNRDEIKAARPKVSKNSAGYALWNVEDRERGTFDLTKLVVGSQGTLALVTRATLGLVRTKRHRAMLVVFLSDIAILPDIVHRILKFDPESFESYDDQTFRLAVHFLPQMLRQMGIFGALRLGFSFLPEVGMVVTGGVPKLILMAEFAEDSPETAREKAREARRVLSDLPVQTKLVSETGAQKYWKVRRESFKLLRQNTHGLHASPFIDDFVVDPDTYPRFLPELYALLKQYDLLYTIAGHIGNGNFHIIPLMNLAERKARDTILELAPKVYALVKKYNGSTTGEHNDGIIRTPFLNDMFSPKMIELFGEVKRIFDPLGVFNPGKKVGGSEEDIRKYMIKTSV